MNTSTTSTHSEVLAKAIAKVQALRALASNNANENEQARATEAADRIMQEYRISQAELEAAGSVASEPFVKVVVSEGGRRTAWRETLLHSICDHYGACFYLSSYRSGGDYGVQGRRGSKGVQAYTVVGRKSDTDIIQYMFTWLEAEIMRLCRFATGGKGVKAAGGYLVGCAAGVASQFYDMRQKARVAAQASTSAAMVLLDKRGSESRAHMEKEIGTKKASVVRGVQGTQSQWEGYNDGKKIQLKDGLPQGNQTKPNALEG